MLPSSVASTWTLLADWPVRTAAVTISFGSVRRRSRGRTAGGDDDRRGGEQAEHAGRDDGWMATWVPLG